MRRRLSHLGRSLVPLAAVACSACQHTENYRWQRISRDSFNDSLTNPVGSNFPQWSSPSVSIYSFPTLGGGGGELGLKDLSDRGQAALIEAMTRNGAKPDEIRDALAKPLKAKSAPGESDVTTEGSYKRTLVATVTKGWSARPGDRLVWTWIDIRPLNFLFDGYSIVATDNQLLNIEQVTNATTGGVNASLGKTGSETSTTNTAGSPISSVLQAVTGSTAGVSGSVSNTYTTTAAINQQYMKLGADILPTELRIYRESERNLDVAGNTLIALTMRLDPSRWAGVTPNYSWRVSKMDLAKDDGSFKTPSDITFEASLNKAPPRCDLRADVTLYYQVRRPKSGRSYVEGEQNATYTNASYAVPNAIIVPADEVPKRSWRVYSKARPLIAVQLTNHFNYNNPVDFTTFEQAHDFATWLNANPSVLGGGSRGAIGKAGLELSSGIEGEGLVGPFFADRIADPPNLAADCAGTMGIVAKTQPPPGGK